MPRKKQNRNPNYKLIKATELYHVGELANTIYVHVNTVNNMIKNGMQVVEGSYPQIIRGQFAIDYLKDRRNKSKTKLKQDEIYCLPCRKPYKPEKQVVKLKITAPKKGNLQSNCPYCGNPTNRGMALQDLPKFQEVMNIAAPQGLPLTEGINNSGTCETKEV